MFLKKCNSKKLKFSKIHIFESIFEQKNRNFENDFLLQIILVHNKIKECSNL